MTYVTVITTDKYRNAESDSEAQDKEWETKTFPEGKDARLFVDGLVESAWDILTYIKTESIELYVLVPPNAKNTLQEIVVAHMC